MYQGSDSKHRRRHSVTPHGPGQSWTMESPNPTRSTFVSQQVDRCSGFVTDTIGSDEGYDKFETHQKTTIE